MANYLKHGASGSSSQADEAKEMLRPMTPRSEMPRSSYGSLLMSAQSVQGLCSLDRKCVRKDGHNGAHWPEET